MAISGDEGDKRCPSDGDIGGGGRSGDGLEQHVKVRRSHRPRHGKARQDKAKCKAGRKFGAAEGGPKSSMARHDWSDLQGRLAMSASCRSEASLHLYACLSAAILEGAFPATFCVVRSSSKSRENGKKTKKKDSSAQSAIPCCCSCPEHHASSSSMRASVQQIGLSSASDPLSAKFDFGLFFGVPLFP